MAAKTILVVSSLITLAFTAPQAFAGNAAPDMAAAPTQQISPPTSGSDTNAQPPQPPHKHKKRQQQQPGSNPQPGNGAANPG